MNDDIPSVILIKPNSSKARPGKKRKRRSNAATHQVQSNSETRQIDWGAIVVAIMVTLGWTIVVGLSAGLFAILCGPMLRDLQKNLIVKALYIGIALCISMYPTVKGTENLIKNISSDYRRQCLIYALIHIVVDIVVCLLISDPDSTIEEWLWLFFTIPVVLVTLRFSENKVE
jgi:cytochrome bd-type quinol oxidase subunit 2